MPNRTFLAYFGSLSGEFGRAYWFVLKIPMAEDLNQTSLMCCRSVPKTLCLGIYITYIWPSDHDIMVILGQ